MKSINKKENQITFSIESNESLLNAIRKYVNQIPILAIDEVDIAKNDSALYDETIAHRIGLIPLKADGKIDEKSTYTLKLESTKEGVVYSGEMSGKIKVAYEKIPITSLNKDQELNLTATIKSGKGCEHARFSPGLMFYRNAVNIKIEKDCPLDVAKSCPKNVLSIKDEKIIVKDEFLCDMCEACIDVCEKKEKDGIRLIPSGEIVATLESFGQIEPKEIFNMAIVVLKKDLMELDKKLK